MFGEMNKLMSRKQIQLHFSFLIYSLKIPIFIYSSSIDVGAEVVQHISYFGRAILIVMAKIYL